MEFVLVSFPALRDVNVDGALQGQTGQVINVGAGLHRFDLGVPRDYTPLSQRLPVGGTTFATPLQIVFTPALAVTAAAPGPIALGPARRIRPAGRKPARRKSKPAAGKKKAAGKKTVAAKKKRATGKKKTTRQSHKSATKTHARKPMRRSRGK